MKVLKFFVFFFLSIFLVLLTCFLLIFFSYFFTKKDITKYVSDDFDAIVKVESVSNLYSNLIDVKAIDLILEEIKMSQYIKTINEIRQIKILKNPIVKFLANIPVYVVFKDNQSVIVSDLKIVSPLINFLNLENIDKNIFKKVEKGSYIVNVDKQKFYLKIINNILIFSFKEIPEIKNSINANVELLKLIKKFEKNNIVNMYINSDFVKNTLEKTNKLVESFFKEITISKYLVVNINISNDEIYLSFNGNLQTENKSLKEIFNIKDKSFDVVKYLPDTTNLLFKFGLGSIEDIYGFYVSLLSEKEKESFNTIDNSLKMVVGMNLKELIFDWCGNDIGAFADSSSNDLVYYLKIKNKKAFEKMLVNLEKSYILEKGENLIFNGVRLTKFNFPPILQGFINLFAKRLEMPYILELEDYIFLSENPDLLSNIVTKYNANSKLMFNNSFKTVYNKTDQKAEVIVYYNTDNSKFNLFDNRIINGILNLYQNGIITMSIKGGNLNIQINSKGVNEKFVTNYPGFPKVLKENLTNEFHIGFFSNNKLPDFLFVDEEGNLNGFDISVEKLKNFPVNIEKNAKIINIENSEVTVFTPGGVLYKLDKEANNKGKFPVKTNYSKIGAFFYFNKKFYYFNSSNMKMEFVDQDGNISEIDFSFEMPIIQDATVTNNFVVFTNLSPSGDIFLLNKDNTIKKIFSANKQIRAKTTVDNQANIVFITVDGDLYRIDQNGNVKSGFPINFEGIFINQPEVTNSNIYIISSDGILRILDSNGKEIKIIELPKFNYKNLKTTLFDVNYDGKEDILIYNAGSFVSIFLTNINRFEVVKGYTKPYFTNFDGDKNIEMVTTTLNNELAVYTFRKK